MRDHLVLLIGEETEADDPTTEAFQADIALYERFHEIAADAIVDGHALEPTPQAMTVRFQTDGPPLVTEGPYSEAVEVVGGLYVLRAEDLDEVIELARHIPAAEKGHVEIRPMVRFWQPKTPRPDGTRRYLAFLRGKETDADQPGIPSWDASVAEHADFAERHGSSLLSGAALHPAAAATTLKVRDGELIVTDGPFAGSTEVIGGYYLLCAASPQEAAKIAQDVPLGPTDFVELRPRVESTSD
jgi:hypothetical protein